MIKSLSLRIPGLFLHYKGGRYRELFQGSFTRVSPSRADKILLTGWNSDHTDEEPRPVVVYVSNSAANSAGIYVYDRNWQETTDTRAVVYVSLTYGSVWARSAKEFFGLVEHNGKSVCRFRSQ